MLMILNKGTLVPSSPWSWHSTKCELQDTKWLMTCRLKKQQQQQQQPPPQCPPVVVPRYPLWLRLIEVDQRASTCNVRGLQQTLLILIQPMPPTTPIIHLHHHFCPDQRTKAPPISRFFVSPIS